MGLLRDYSEYTDEQLLILIKQSSQGAFTAVYDRYAEKLFAIAYNFAKRKDIAEEMVQDVFMRLWERRCSVEVNSLSAYLATAIKFSVFTYLQKEFRRKKILERIPLSNEFYSGDSEANAIFLKERLEKAIRSLPERCRVVYQYSREGGMSVKEIAKQMDLAPKTVENHLLRALNAVRVALKNAYFSVALFFLLHFF